MRVKIEYGIDLGTTNSSIARMEGGVPVIKKSDTLKDTLPSSVHFTRKQDVLVGDQAVAAMKNDNTRALKKFEKSESNTFMEFKRTMGTTHTYASSHMNKSFTSEELSAEVLKKLKSFIQDENIASIVITVPAKFLNPQNEATMKAAKLAGFNQVHLLQEPVAAATAYGLSSKIKDGYLLVFDFGGGTFDAALLKSDEGILSIKDTEGDNWLGGKNIDEAIVDQIIIKYLRENYSIDNILDDPEKREILRNAVKPFAEEAKIQLSFKDSHNMLSNLGDLPFEDENGIEPEIDINIGLMEMENAVAPIFQKAIEITKDLLSRNHLKGSDLAALILVGGPTYSPILRRMLKEQIADKVDTSVDPMTVVAKGAALFASTISISEDEQAKTRDKTKLQLELKYESTSVESEEMINIRLLREKTTGSVPEKIYVDLVRKPEGFATGKKLISAKATLIDVLLESNCPNEFEIISYDDKGNKMECQPNTLTILQGIGGVDSMQVLPYHIGIVKYFQAEERDLFYPVKGLEKNKAIKSGITGVADNLHTRQDIRPGVKADMIRIPIYQGEYNALGTNPDLNYHITDVIISGELLPKMLPIGSPVNIRIKIDSSSLMTFIAEFPTIEHEEELKIEIQQAEAPSQDTLYSKIKEAKSISKKTNRADLNTKLDELELEIENIGASADGRLRLMDGYRKVLLDLDKAEKETEWPKAEKELKDSFFVLEDLIGKIKQNSDDGNLKMEVIESHIEEYRKKIELIIKEKNTREAKELKIEIDQMDYELRNLVSGNAMDAHFLKYINDSFSSYHWKNPAKARQLINQGMQMVVNGNTQGLRPVLIELVGLMPDDEKPHDTLE
ncbi:Hsp70 family protein [Candidatus Nomurabacteria bacterium]|nr:Hsp70 family protein [Candidatus Nomurabacteria bacterium]